MYPDTRGRDFDRLSLLSVRADGILAPIVVPPPAYVRLHWDTVMRDTDADRQLVDEAIQNAISELR